MLALGGRPDELADASRCSPAASSTTVVPADSAARMRWRVLLPNLRGRRLVVARLEREDEPVARGLDLLGFGEPAGGERGLEAGIRVELGIHGEDRSARIARPAGQRDGARRDPSGGSPAAIGPRGA